jgi:hypothetical protein
MYRLIDHKQNILRPKGDQSFHTVWAHSKTLREYSRHCHNIVVGEFPVHLID